MSRTRTAAFTLAVLLLSHAAYFGGQRWWQHALRQPQVLASAPHQVSPVTVADTGVAVVVATR